MAWSAAFDLKVSQQLCRLGPKPWDVKIKKIINKTSHIFRHQVVLSPLHHCRKRYHAIANTWIKTKGYICCIWVLNQAPQNFPENYLHQDTLYILHSVYIRWFLPLCAHINQWIIQINVAALFCLISYAYCTAAVITRVLWWVTTRYTI